MNPIDLRPRTATEIVDTTFRICRVHYGALVTAMIVVNAPASNSTASCAVPPIRRATL